MMRLTHKMLVPGYKKDHYVVIERLRAMKEGFMLTLYRCLCDCGEENLLTKSNLERSKGCAKCKHARARDSRPEPKNPVGYKKDGYTILERVEKRISESRMSLFYRVRCDCGVEKTIARSTFEKSSGCIECRVKRFEGRLGRKKIDV